MLLDKQQEAEGFFSNSLSLAEQENKTRAVKEKVTSCRF